jgi:hypothetical protein
LLLFAFTGTAVVYVFRVVDAWIHGDVSTNSFLTILGALWVFICSCVMGMDYLSSSIPRGPLTKLGEGTPRLHGSPWVYAIAIGSVVALLVVLAAPSLYRKYASQKKTRAATYHLRRKEGEKKGGPTKR